MTTRNFKIDTAGQIGSLPVPNRLVRSATAERLATEHAGRVTPALIDLYRSLAAGGVGLIVTGHAYVAAAGKAHPEMTGAFCDTLIDGLATLVTAVHEAGGLMAMQINHAGRQVDPVLGLQPLAPSTVPSPAPQGFAAARPAREMSHADIVTAVDAFGHAARRARSAGFDAVQIHAAHGYLVSQFLSPHTNRRTDAWGGDFERRLKFLAAVCEAVRGQVGRDYPVFVKLGMVDNLERLPGGLTLDDGARIVGRLAALGLDAVEVSSGDGGGTTNFSIRRGVGRRHPEAYFRSLARRARAATSLPVILVGGLRTRTTIDEVLASGDADFIAMCRPLIREPHLPRRLLAGEATAAACASCGRCWPSRMGEGIACKCGG
ncbi:MAG TPA: NADH:flavin oxidoreductase [Anaerolineae bacterium]|nr:NADH:flavin oxidoreductase [Anaerolineae bacterium]